MKYLIIFCFVTSLGSIICGLTFDFEYSEKLIGYGTIALFIVTFPLFIYYRWKDKNFKDYMLNNENLEKMRENQRKNKI